MANKLYEETHIQNIANAIRQKNGSSDSYTVSQMADVIKSIPSENGGITPTGTINITANGTYDVTSYAQANVNIVGGSADFKSGEFVLDEDFQAYKTGSRDNSYVIPHTLGKTPTLFMLYIDKYENEETISSMIFSGYYNANLAMVSRWSTTTGSINSGQNAISVDEENIYIQPTTNNFYLKAGYTYKWIAM